jgi:TRAP-type C4-dicarboxylate transport system permease small subunit
MARLLGRIVQILEILSSIVLAAMMLLTFADVVGRYILGAPVFGASEMISSMLALIIFLGLGIANARDKHIVVELFDTRVRNIAPGFYDIIVQGFSIAAMCLIVFVLFQQAYEAAHLGSTTIVLEWPLAWITGAAAVLAALSVVSQVLGLLTGAGKAHHLEDM